ncbi:ArsR/SmtB family transcription factor [Stappia sp.]|uniref:ArsR/SmtB family transcription factor n=1 Tax=Stappia sp. TaxID=1870903 RepID=UPI003A98DC10
MDKITALEAFAALSQETRLDVLRLLIRAGGEGMLAGDIAVALDVRQNTMSTNLAVLHRSGLVRNERQGRAVRYFADMAGLRSLLSFLMEDCCGGAPDLCRPVLDALVCDC